MELNEAVQRIVVGNWRTLLLCLLVAVNVVVARSMFDSTPAYSSVARIQASSTPPRFGHGGRIRSQPSQGAGDERACADPDHAGRRSHEP